MMRQAGRYLPEYREVRSEGQLPRALQDAEAGRRGDAAADPALRLRRRDPVLGPAGAARGDGAGGRVHRRGARGCRRPCARRPIWRASRRFDPAARTGFVMETIRRCARELARDAAHRLRRRAVHGRHLRHRGEDRRRPSPRRRSSSTASPPTRTACSPLIGEATRDYLLAQIEAGAQAVQLFDSWVGVLSAEDFETFALPPTRGAGRRAARHRRAGHLLRQRRGRDPRPRGARRRRRLRRRLAAADRRGARPPGRRAAPCRATSIRRCCSGPSSEIERRARDVVRRGGKRGHVFNLGHGITPDVPHRGASTGAGAPPSGAPDDRAAAATPTAHWRPQREPLGLIALNLGGPDSLDDVEPFLRRLFADPDVIQLGWLSPLQPLLARMIAQRAGAAVARGLRADRRALARSAPRRPRRPQAVAAALARRGHRRRARSSRWLPGTRWPTRRWPSPGGARRPARRRAAALPARVAHHHRLVARPARGARARKPGGSWRSPRSSATPTPPATCDAVVDADRGGDRPPCRRELRADGAGAVLGPRPARGVHPPRRSLPRRHPHHRRGGHAAAGARAARAPLLPEPRRPAALARPHDRGGAGRAGRRRATRAVVVVPDRLHRRAHRDAAGDRHPLPERAEKAGIVHFARARTVGCHPAFIARAGRSGRGGRPRARLGVGPPCASRSSAAASPA